MKQFGHKISKLIFRHPILYYVRYLLLSKNNREGCADQIGCFNDVNKLQDIPQLYFDVNAEMKIDQTADDFEKAIAIGRYLRMRIAGGTGLGLTSEKTLQHMLDGKGGVCSDFSQIFSIFCFINQIKVKEWGCIDRFYKSRFGHSFNEIYASQHAKWIAIDIHKGIYFNDAEGRTLSAIELFDYLRKGNPLQYTLFSDYIPKKIDRIPCVYSKSTIPFLVSNYKSGVNDYFMKRFRKFPPFMVNAIMILYRKNHDFVFVMDNYKMKLLPKPIRNLRLISFF